MNLARKSSINTCDNKGTIFLGLSQSKQNILLGVVLLVVTVIAYVPVFSAGYIWDDDDYVTENRSLTDAAGLENIWIPFVLHDEESKQAGLVTPQYYPVVFTTFWIESLIYPTTPLDKLDNGLGLNPFGFHAVNLALHIFNALLLVLLARLIRIPVCAAWAIGFIFALHPVNVESVAWITERKNVLSTLFYLLAAMTYLRFDKQRIIRQSAVINDTVSNRKNTPWAWYFLSLFLFVFALLSKSVVASLPIALVLILLFMRERLSIKRLWPLVPMLFLGAIAGLHTGFIEKVNVGALGPAWDLSFVERLFIASRAFLFYPSKIIVPLDLVFIYPRWEVNAGSIIQFWPLLVSVVCGLFLVVLWWKKGIRWPFLAAAFYGISIFPALGFANVYPHQFSFVADHFQYLASIGIIILVVGCVGVFSDRFLKHRKPVSLVLTTLMLAGMATLTFMQGTHYYDAETLYLKTVEANPKAWMAHSNLSRIYLKRAVNHLDNNNDNAGLEAAKLAEQYAKYSLEIKPDHDTALTNAAEAMRLQQKYGDAIVLATKAVDSMKNEQQYHLDHINKSNRSVPLLLNMLLHLDVDEGHARLAKLNEMTLAQNYSLLGRLYENENDLQAAKLAYSEAVALENPPMVAHEALGRISMLDKRFDDALEHFQQVLERYPDNVRTLILYADSLRKLGQYSNAKQQLIHALNVMNPDDEIKIVYALAWLSATAKDATVRDAQYALTVADQMIRETKQQDPNAFDLLAVALAENGRYEDAVKMAGEAKKLAEAYEMTDLVKQIEKRIDIYKTGKPYRE